MNASLSDENEPVIDIFILSANSSLSAQLEKQLLDEGYYVTLFSDGTHLLETLRNGKPNLLMCDTTSPDADAFEVCRQIKADDYLWNIPVLIITGASDLGDLLRVLDCNADNFIAHPFDPPYLLSLIEGTLVVPVERPTPDQIKTQFKIKHDEQVFVVTADRRKLLEFLLSSFEIAVNKSTDLYRAQENIRNLSITTRKLEENVQENTKVIGIINENLKSKEQKLAEITGQLSDREQALRERIAAIDALSRGLETEKTSLEEAQSRIQRVEKEKDESTAAHQMTIDQLQRQVSGQSSELATIKPALEQVQSELARESGQRKEIADALITTTSLKELAEKALSALATEFEQLKFNFGAEKNRAQEAEDELKAVLQAKDQSEQDLTQIINDLKTTAKEQAVALTRLREESALEIARQKEEQATELSRLREESASEIARQKEEQVTERSRLLEESALEIARQKEELVTERSRLLETEENLKAVSAAKERSEASLLAMIDAGKKDILELEAQLNTVRSQLNEKEQAIATLDEETASVRSAKDSMEQELTLVSRTLSSHKEDFARVYEEKEKAEALGESLGGTLKDLQDQLEQEKRRSRDSEERMKVIIQQRDRELGELRTAHDNTRTALSSHATTLEQAKRDFESAVSATQELEGRLEQVKSNLEQVKTSLEKETVRREESEDQLRDALSQQQQLEQDLERVVSESKSLYADLNTEKRMHEETRNQNRSLEDQVSALIREKSEAEKAAADLSAEIDQARVALADEWEDHMTDKERLAAVPEKKPLVLPAPYPGVKREAEILKKRSLIVKVPNIPAEIRPLPRSMVAIDPVRISEPDSPHIKSVEDLYEDDDDDQKKQDDTPRVSIIQEPAEEPVRDVLPDAIPGHSPDHEGFFEDNGYSGSDTLADEDDPDSDDSASDSSDAAPVSADVAFNRAQWLDLLKWSHHCDVLEPEQRMQIVRMGRLIQKGRRLTRHQEEQVLEMITLVKRLGYRIS